MLDVKLLHPLQGVDTTLAANNIFLYMNVLLLFGCRHGIMQLEKQQDNFPNSMLDHEELATRFSDTIYFGM